MSEESLFREVNEDLRGDRMRNLWRRYGLYLIGAAVAVVVLVAANEGYTWWSGSNAARSSDELYSAFDAVKSGDMAVAQKALDKVIAEGSGQYPLLARFEEAALLAKAGKSDEAAKAYDALAASSNEIRLRELALLFAAYAEVDKGDVGAVRTRVEGLIAANSPLRDMAREALGLAQYKSGALADSRATFEAITADPGASLQQLSRIQVYLSQLTAEGIAPVEKPAAAAATGSATPTPVPAAAPAK